MTAVESIALVLGDNDYGNTFRPLLESINRVIAHREQVTEEQVRRLILDGISWHYSAFQGRGVAPDAKLLAYLERVTILFNADARAGAATRDHDSGAWFLNVDMGEVYSY